MPIPGFLANIEDEHPDVGAGSHEVQRGWVVLVPLQGLFGLQLLLNNNKTEPQGADSLPPSSTCSEDR
jgi:hypothetical protein